MRQRCWRRGAFDGIFRAANSFVDVVDKENDPLIKIDVEGAALDDIGDVLAVAQPCFDIKARIFILAPHIRISLMIELIELIEPNRVAIAPSL